MVERVVAALSGGVDSSVAAALLVEEGFEVIGVMMRLWPQDENRCCSLTALGDAERVASHLGIRFHLLDLHDEFKALVVDRFVAEYGMGRTPNPCLLCNGQIRFRRLLGTAKRLGARYVATGHYAQVIATGNQYHLHKGADPDKDQSYVLYMLDQSSLSRVLFPVGRYTKEAIRGMAQRFALDVADKADSMDLCFVPDDGYRRFLRSRIPQAIRPGPILDQDGREIGRHEGLPLYTVGQRKGLGISSSEALYVIKLDAERNALVVGPGRELGRRKLQAAQVSYVGGDPPDGPTRVQAKIRYRAVPADAWWSPMPGRQASVTFDNPLRDITPGQAVVAYTGDVVLGGGIISD